MLELTTERRTDTEDYVCAPSDLPRQVRPLHHAQTGCRFDFTFGLKPAEKARNSTKKTRGALNSKYLQSSGNIC